MKNAKPWLFKALVMLPALSLVFAVSAASVLAADVYPSRPVHLIVPFAPGGPDIIARVIAPKLGERLGVPVIVENRPGAGGVLGTDTVAKAAPDGYTLQMLATYFTINPSFYALPYDPIKSFTPVAKIMFNKMLLLVHPSVPANSVQELIALMKQKPGQLIWAAAGIGTQTHLSAELFKIESGTDFKILQFKGGGAAQVDMMGGHSHIASATEVQVLANIRAGKMRALATTGQKRAPNLPDVPTTAEAGLPGYTIGDWNGIIGPAGLPAAIVDRLNKEIKAVLVSDELKRFYQNEGSEMDYSGPAEFGKFIASELDRWKSVVKKANIKVD